MAEAQARKRAAEQGESEQCQNGYGNWGCGDRWQTPVHYDASEGVGASSIHVKNSSMIRMHDENVCIVARRV